VHYSSAVCIEPAARTAVVAFSVALARASRSLARWRGGGRAVDAAATWKRHNFPFVPGSGNVLLHSRGATCRNWRRGMHVKSRARPYLGIRSYDDLDLPLPRQESVRRERVACTCETTTTLIRLIQFPTGIFVRLSVKPRMRAIIPRLLATRDVFDRGVIHKLLRSELLERGALPIHFIRRVLKRAVSQTRSPSVCWHCWPYRGISRCYMCADSHRRSTKIIHCTLRRIKVENYEFVEALLIQLR